MRPLRLTPCRYSVTVDVSALMASLCVYPNPAVNYIVVTHAKAEQASFAELADMTGKVIKRNVAAAGDVQNNMIVAGLAKGTYTVVYRSGNLVMNATLVVR